MALPKIKRLSSSEITEVARKGKVFDSDFFRIKFLPVRSTGGPKTSRFALVISSKVSKKAVERNKIRRRVSEVVKSPAFEKGPGLVLILIKPRALGKEFGYLRDDLGKVLNKINQWGE